MTEKGTSQTGGRVSAIEKRDHEEREKAGRCLALGTTGGGEPGFDVAKG